MRISEHYSLDGDQGTFDFIDVDTEKDTPLFIDPSVLMAIDSPWANQCASGIQSFFQAVLDCISSEDENGAMALLSYLGEDNSTHLGYSARSRGSGVGGGLARKFYEDLSSSNAVRTGMISDLEDTALLIEGVGEDRISDVTTNIIREQLVSYTQETAKFYGIPMAENLAIGPFWNPREKVWHQKTVSLPVASGEPLILVPKSIVRRVLFHDPSEYYRHYVLDYFTARELDRRSPLTYTVKGKLSIRKTDVEAKYRGKHGAGTGNPGVEKRVNLDGTSSNPELLNSFKENKKANPPRAISNSEIAEVMGVEVSDFGSLLERVTSVKPGSDEASDYEKSVESLLAALFYPVLVNPIRQEKIHDGRKIIDISFTNMARHGFFEWLSKHYPSANVMVECKNYTRPLANPEMDQLSGRFSPSRGRYGILVYRSFSDKDKVLSSMRDAAKDDRGFMVALDDDDLAVLVQEKTTTGSCMGLGGLLHERFKKLIS